MKKLSAVIFMTAVLFISGCSSDKNLTLEALKETYPDNFGKPVEDTLSESEQEALGLPSELAFTPEEVKAASQEQETEVTYSSDSEKEVLVLTKFNPENNIKTAEEQVTLDSGSVAGIKRGDASVIFEWYDSEDNVIYQFQYTSGDDEKRLEEALEMVNSI
ncbi:hypothetical protein [Halobacillus sp. Marseille-Q1614]|uniref:hypothetical protein n=1 Tax=Halobacillus sp. Marseille-Q1614 TaxID=2709134 RepID=UPI00156E3FAE|nr:hypothetical protein [Halobacillus sp. Marseille-Q1614]